MAIRFNPLLALPPLLFAAFAGVALLALKRENPGELPSALIDQPAPSLALAEPLGTAAPVSDALLRNGEIKLVNFWASWCGPCRIEHPVLTELEAEGLPIVGINYKDAPDAAAGFLAELGDPYDAIGVDRTGRIGIDWGLYGVPETFVVDGDGSILMRHPGPLTPEIVESRIRPLLDATD